MSDVAPHIVRAKQCLAEGHQRLKQEHKAGASGVDICRRISDLRDSVILDLFSAALADLGEDGPHGLLPHVALVAHGGYGRRDVAPFSDVDLMILHDDVVSARVAPVASRLTRDIFDGSLALGHSVRTPSQACRLALQDAAVCTSLVESRLLAGDPALFERFQRQLQPRGRSLLSAVIKHRTDERLRFGDTVFLLQPNVKQSPGALRELQLLRWIGMIRYGTNDPRQLRASGLLLDDDLEIVEDAREFLLRLRNEMHFHAGRASDVLDRGEQLRIATLRRYSTETALLPVERLMREYFRHTAGVSHVVNRLAAKAQSREGVARLASAVFGRRVEGGVRVGIMGMFVTREGAAVLRKNLVEIMRLVALSNLYDKPFTPSTWEAIRREAARLPDELPAEACRRFLSLLACPNRIARLLRDLHDVGVLERFVPEFEHARGLLQFDEYHKYTVDEHCLRAVAFAEDLRNDDGPLGKTYYDIKRKHVLHLAVLIHDLGKGQRADHRELGEAIAERTADRLGMTSPEVEMLKFLVRHHDLMNHLAFRRDTSDERLVVQFAVQVGTPELLRMMYVLTAADLAAVGPRVWDGWKNEVLTSLFQQAMRHLAGNSGATAGDEQLRSRPVTAAGLLEPRGGMPWFKRQLDSLPADYLAATEPGQIAEDLMLLHEVTPGKAMTSARYLPESESVQFTVGAPETITTGIFYRLTGALTGEGLNILSAQIHTLADGLVLDRFRVRDPDFRGEPPEHRLSQVNAALAQSLQEPAEKTPSFRRVWRADRPPPVETAAAKTHVRVDNTTSGRFTILDVFAIDRPGLLYAVARALFQLRLSVARAKIDTLQDQVVDVFYVTDENGEKIIDDPRLETIRRLLMETINGLQPEENHLKAVQ